MSLCFLFKYLYFEIEIGHTHEQFEIIKTFVSFSRYRGKLKVIFDYGTSFNYPVTCGFLFQFLQSYNMEIFHNLQIVFH